MISTTGQADAAARRRPMYALTKDLLGQNDVIALGQSATISMTTKRPAQITIEIGLELERRPSGLLVWTDNGEGQRNIIDSHVGPAGTTSFTTKFIRLRPRARYVALITALDETNYTYQQFSGTFNTLTRHIEAKLVSVEMLDDSDETGSCECAFQFGIGSQYVDYFRGDWSTGNAYAVDKTFDVNYQKRAPLSMKFHAEDDDSDFSSSPMVAEPSPYLETGVGTYGDSNDDFDKADVWDEIDLNPNPQGNENISGTLFLPTTGYVLKYVVKIEYVVSYSNQ
jgi:hypothetical protein